MQFCTRFHQLNVFHIFQKYRETKHSKKFFKRTLSQSTASTHPQTYFQAIFVLFGSADQKHLLTKTDEEISTQLERTDSPVVNYRTFLHQSKCHNHSGK